MIEMEIKSPMNWIATQMRPELSALASLAQQKGAKLCYDDVRRIVWHRLRRGAPANKQIYLRIL